MKVLDFYLNIVSSYMKLSPPTSTFRFLTRIPTFYMKIPRSYMTIFDFYLNHSPQYAPTRTHPSSHTQVQARKKEAVRLCELLFTTSNR